MAKVADEGKDAVGGRRRGVLRHAKEEGEGSRTSIPFHATRVRGRRGIAWVCRVNLLVLTACTLLYASQTELQTWTNGTHLQTELQTTYAKSVDKFGLVKAFLRYVFYRDCVWAASMKNSHKIDLTFHGDPTYNQITSSWAWGRS